MNTLLGIYLPILLGLLVFSLDSYFMTSRPITNSFPNDLGLYWVPLIAMSGYFGSQFIFDRMLRTVGKENDIKQKMALYLRASIYRYIILGGAAFIGILAVRESRYIFYLVIAVFLVLYLIKLRPNKKRAMDELKLKGRDRESLENTDKGIL